MKMKRAIATTAVTICIVLISGSAFATEEIVDGRAMIQAERESIIRDEMVLTEQEAAAFWPVYAEYRSKYDAVMERYGAMITEYIQRYDDAELSNEFADELIVDYLALKTEMLDVQKEYVPRMREILPAMQVARFFQLEIKFNTEIDSQLSQVIPLVDPS